MQLKCDVFSAFSPSWVTCVKPLRGDLVIKTDIMHIVAHEKGKLAVKRGRKTTGPGLISGQRGYRSEQGLQV